MCLFQGFILCLQSIISTRSHGYALSASSLSNSSFILKTCVTSIHVWAGYVAAMLKWIILLFFTPPLHCRYLQLKPSAQFNLWCVHTSVFVSTGIIALTSWLDRSHYHVLRLTSKAIIPCIADDIPLFAELFFFYPRALHILTDN